MNAELIEVVDEAGDVLGQVRGQGPFLPVFNHPEHGLPTETWGFGSMGLIDTEDAALRLVGYGHFTHQVVKRSRSEGAS